MKTTPEIVADSQAASEPQVRSSAWFGVGSPKYKILFARNSVFECFSPPCGRIKAEIFAWLYRMKGEGRDAVVVDAKWASDELNAMQKREDILLDFINREMRMTAADPRVDDLAKRLAAASNGGTQRPGTPDGSLATETRKPGSLE